MASVAKRAYSAAASRAALRAAKNGDALVGLSERLKKLCYRALFVAEDQSEMGSALLHLVQLIIDNLSEFRFSKEILHNVKTFLDRTNFL